MKLNNGVSGQQKCIPTTRNGLPFKLLRHTILSSCSGIRILVDLPGHITNKQPFLCVSTSSDATVNTYKNIFTCFRVAVS